LRDALKDTKYSCAESGRHSHAQWCKQLEEQFGHACADRFMFDFAHDAS
jgi:hypothetical protein